MKRMFLLVFVFGWIATLSTAAWQGERLGLRVIVVRTEAEAADLQARLRAGENFEELARRHSVDPSARAGGYFGVIAISDLRAEFQDALKGLSPGQVSPVARVGRDFALLELVPVAEPPGAALADAVTKGDTTRLKALLGSGQGVDADALKRLWVMAAVANHIEIMRVLLDAGADVNTRFEDGSTALIAAAFRGHLDTVRILLNARADLNAAANVGATAVMAAAAGGHADIVRALVDAGANASTGANNGSTPLKEAADRGFTDTVRILLAAGAATNTSFEDGSTVLMAAARAGHTEIARALVGARADVNAQARNGSTALLEAAYSGDLDIVRLLLAAGAGVNPSLEDGSTALMIAAQAGHTEIVRVLLDAGADVKALARNGLTALMNAAYAGHLGIARLLLDAGSDAKASLNDGSTVLMAAAAGGHSEIVRALLNAGADVNAGVDGESTALMEAAYPGHLDSVRILLEAGANVNQHPKNGLTALMAAALGGHTEVVRALVDAGADVKARDSKDWSALTYAAASATPATVRAVLGSGGAASPEEYSIAAGSTYINEYYSSNEANLLDLASAEFQKVLDTNPGHIQALTWMGATEVLRWNEAPTLEQFRRANSLLKKCVDLDPSGPERHYWIAATNSIFTTRGKGASETEYAAILEEGIVHAQKAVELNPTYWEALTYVSVLYRQKVQRTSTPAERDRLLRIADAASQDALRISAQRGNRASIPTDQFTRPAPPPPPTTGR